MKRGTLVLLGAAALGVYLWKRNAANDGGEVAAGATTPNQMQPLASMPMLEVGKFINAVVPEGATSTIRDGLAKLF